MFEMVGVPTVTIVATSAVFVRDDGQWQRDREGHQKDTHLSTLHGTLLVSAHVE
jgi:hypothetical protein